jgi:glycosyltransferase involved in cell wall biosynthesis
MTTSAGRAPFGDGDRIVEAPRVLSVQDGSRLNYAVPVALAKAGMLDQVFTEWYSAPGSLQARAAQAMKLIRPGLGQRMAERCHPELDPGLVRSNPWLLLKQEAARSRFRDIGRYRRWRAASVTEWIARRGFGRANVLHGFITNLDPALACLAGARGLLAIGDQISQPTAAVAAERRRQFDRWPDWETEPRGDPDGDAALADWEQRTWRALDHIICLSPMVRRDLLAAGIASPKVSVLPYPCPFAVDPGRGPAARTGPLTVGFVGTVSLLKGAPYFVEVARRFKSRQVRFVMVGGIRLKEPAARAIRAAVELVGQVPRSAVRDWLADFDLFYFPSTSEGFGNVVPEAMSAGLPVITSPISSAVVRDGEDGYVVPYDDLDQAEARIAALIADSALRRSMGEAAQRRAAALNSDWYSAELAALVGRLHEARLTSAEISPAAPPSSGGRPA